jgi:peroxiredoxin
VLHEITSLNAELHRLTRSIDLPGEVVETIAHSILLASHHVRGRKIGELAPDFELPNQRGERVTLSGRLNRGPAVVCFFRGEWCPYCVLEMQALRAMCPLVATRRASLICIHPQRVDVSERMAVESDMDVCHDESQQVLSAYQVRFPVDHELAVLYRDSFGLDLAMLNANGQWNLPVPATFIVDETRVIKARQFHPDFRVRVEPGYILQALDRLPESSPEFVAPKDCDDSIRSVNVALSGSS